MIVSCLGDAALVLIAVTPADGARVLIGQWIPWLQHKSAHVDGNEALPEYHISTHWLLILLFKGRSG